MFREASRLPGSVRHVDFRPGILALLTLLLLSHPEKSRAQSHNLFGLTLGYGYGVPVTIARAPGVVNRYNTSELGGHSSDHLLSIGVEYRIPNFFGMSLQERPISLVLNGTFGMSLGSFTSDPVQLPDLAVKGVDYIHPWATVDVLTRPGFVQSGFLLDYAPLDALHLGAGLWGQYRFSSNFIQTETLDFARDSVYFADSTLSHVVSSGRTLGSSPFRFGPQISAGFPIPIDADMELIPRLTLQLDIAAIADGLGMRSGKVAAGLTLLFGRTRPEEPLQIARETLTPELAEATERMNDLAPRLGARISLVAERDGDSTAGTIGMRRVRYRQVTPLHPVIYFDEGDAALSGRYVTIARQAATGFSMRDLARLDPGGIYYQILNVIGRRLHDYPEARITIDGGRSDREPRPVSLRRAEAVRRYLENVWGIDVGRIDVRAVSVGKSVADEAARRSVRIGSTERQVLAPVVTSWIVEEMAAPPVRVVSEIHAEAGLRRWALTALHGGEEVARYEGASEAELNRVDFSFSLHDDPRLPQLPPLVGELQVEDLAGRSVIVRDELPLRRREGASRLAPETAENISVLLVPSLMEEQEIEMQLRGLASATVAGARLTIVNDPTDEGTAETGTATVNGGMRAGRARAELLAARLRKLIGARGIDATVTVSDRIRDLAAGLEGPEKEAYRGGMRVTIEQRAEQERARP